MTTALRHRIEALEAKLPPPSSVELPDYLYAAFDAYLTDKGLAASEIDSLRDKLIAGYPLMPALAAFDALTKTELQLLVDYLGGLPDDTTD